MTAVSSRWPASILLLRRPEFGPGPPRMSVLVSVAKFPCEGGFWNLGVIRQPNDSPPRTNDETVRLRAIVWLSCSICRRKLLSWLKPIWPVEKAKERASWRSRRRLKLSRMFCWSFVGSRPKTMIGQRRAT